MTLFQAFGQFAGQAAAVANPGMVLITPSSVTSDSTATIVGNGQVTFSTISTMSVNDVFSSAYTNYIISVRHLMSDTVGFGMRMRVSGSDATGADYAYQRVDAGASGTSGSRLTGTSYAMVARGHSSNRSGDTIFIGGPNLAQETVFRHINARGTGDMADSVSVHGLTTSYTGFTLLLEVGAPASTMTGALQVYGLVA